MSFSRAKRFVYKQPDVNCSPADYLLSLDLNKGSRMSKCTRFRQSKNSNEDKDGPVCSRSFHAHNSENCGCRHNKTNLHETPPVFNRNDSLRKSVRTNKKNNNVTKTTKNTNTQQEYVRLNKTSSPCDSDFIDDDYDSMTSSEDLDHLKNLEEYELNEVYKAIKRIKEKRALALTSPKDKRRTYNFEEIVLKKLETIDKNVKTVKEEVASLPQHSRMERIQHHYKPLTGKINLELRTSRTREELKSMIIKTIQKLLSDLDNKRKSVLKNSEKRILKILAEMHASENSSNGQIKALCDMTAEQLAENLNNALQIQTTAYDCTDDDGKIEDMLHELTMKCFSRNMFDDLDDPMDNVTSGYFQETIDESQELEEDLSDITHKCMDTQQMLDVQGALLDVMKGEINNLKTTLN